MTPATPSLAVASDRRLVRSRWHSTRYVVARIAAPTATGGRERPAVNLAFVLDRSGSMGGDKIRLATQAVEEGIARLQARDRFSVVTYDNEVDVLVRGTHATPSACHDAIDRLRTVEARGSTDLGGGWLAGCEQVAAVLVAQGVNRSLLLTDGLANVGITDISELTHHASELRARGVSTSTFGVGDDFNEELLQGMAQAGGGHFYDIATAAAIRDHISSEVGETLEIVAREVSLEVSLPAEVRVESLGAFPLRTSGGRTVITVGDLISGQMLEVPLRISFPLGQVGAAMPMLIGLQDRDGALDGAASRLAWEYALDDANDVQPRDIEVDRVVARIFVARARREAVRLNRAGDYRGARHVLESTGKRIRGYAGRDPELRAIVDALMAEVGQFQQPMPERARKTAYAQSSYVMQSRLAEGQARRSRA